MHATLNDSRQHGWRGAWRLVKTSFVEWWQDDTFRYAAALAFYTIFSVAPILLIAVGAASLFFARDIATERIVAEIQRMVGSQGAQAVRQVIDASTGFGKSIWAIASGLVTFLLGAGAVFAELQAALNKIWDVQAQPRRGVFLSFIFDRLRSFTIALGVGFLLLVSLVVSAALAALQDYFTSWMPGVPGLWQLANVVASFAIAALLFAMIYKYLPDVEITWNDVAIGAVVTAALFTGGKYLIGLYIGQTAAANAFGAAGSFAVLLIWIYYSALVSFLGAEFTQVYARLYGSRIKPSTHAVRVGGKSDVVPK